MNADNRRRRARRGSLLLAVLVAAPAAAGVVVEDAVAEWSAARPDVVAVGFTLRNATTHELELLKAVSDGAARVALQQRSVDAQGQPRLWPVAKFELAPGAQTRLHSRGRFFELGGFAVRPRPGQRVVLTLTFEHEPPLRLSIPVVAAGEDGAPAP